MQIKINKTKTIISLISNFIIFALVVTGILILIFVKHNDWKTLKWFTVQSNVLVGTTALIYFIFNIIELKKNMNMIPKCVEIIKLITTTGVLVTLFFCLFVLIPIHNNWGLLYSSDGIFLHTLVPIFAFLSYILVEHSNHKYFYPETFFCLIHTIPYGIFYIVMALTHTKEGGGFQSGYDWYGIFEKLGITYGCLCIVGVICGSYLIGWLLWLANKKINLFPTKTKNKAKA